MLYRPRIYQVGDWVTVRHCRGGYPLPEGLPDGALVRVAGKDIGYDCVEYGNQRFTVFMGCIESGWETCRNGRWTPVSPVSTA